MSKTYRGRQHKAKEILRSKRPDLIDSLNEKLFQELGCKLSRDRVIAVVTEMCAISEMDGTKSDRRALLDEIFEELAKKALAEIVSKSSRKAV